MQCLAERRDLSLECLCDVADGASSAGGGALEREASPEVMVNLGEHTFFFKSPRSAVIRSADGPCVYLCGQTESESGHGDDGMWRNPFATPREGHSQPPPKQDKAAKVRGKVKSKDAKSTGALPLGTAKRGGVLEDSGLIMWAPRCAVRSWQGQGGQLWGRLPDEKEEHQVQTHTPGSTRLSAFTSSFP